jgi:hypothetical protein
LAGVDELELSAGAVVVAGVVSLLADELPLPPPHAPSSRTEPAASAGISILNLIGYLQWVPHYGRGTRTMNVIERERPSSALGGSSEVSGRVDGSG